MALIYKLKGGPGSLQVSARRGPIERSQTSVDLNPIRFCTGRGRVTVEAGVDKARRGALSRLGERRRPYAYN